MRTVNKLVSLFFLFSGLLASAETWRSGAEPVTLIELFSSEGCSSCPPADAWLSSLRASADLWRKFVPVAFQVDYWNYLGWNDPLSRADYTARQQAHARENGGGVYTPEFFRNGLEQGSRLSQATGPGAEGGGLEVVNEKGLFRVRFAAKSAGVYRVEGALLGNGIARRIPTGENAGKTLRHEFVALSLGSAALERKGAEYVGQLRLPSTERAANAVAFWITKQGSMKPVQAVGGDLN